MLRHRALGSWESGSWDLTGQWTPRHEPLTSPSRSAYAPSCSSSSRRCRSQRQGGAAASRRPTDQPVGRSAARGRSASARSGRRAWAAASTTSPSPRAIPTSSISATRSAASSSPRTTARRSSRCSTPTRRRRSATSRFTRPTRTSSTSAPARRTTARRRRSATASTRRPTAGRPSRNIGLKETQTIARIVIDPKNPETVYVAAPGHLFGPNPERGVYKTTDGGKTWNKVKYVDEDTGFTDIAIDPVEHQHPVRGELPAPAQRLLLQRRRPGQRASGRRRMPARRGRS